MSRNIWHPGTVAFGFRCKPEELLPKLEVYTSVNVFSDLGEYLITPEIAPTIVDVLH